VIGQADEDSGQAICAFVTLEGDDNEGSEELIVEIHETVAKQIGKLARPKRIIWADDLPKTRSGKIMRRLLRDIAEGRALGDVTTLRDPDVMSQLEGRSRRRTRPRSRRRVRRAPGDPGPGHRARRFDRARARGSPERILTSPYSRSAVLLQAYRAGLPRLCSRYLRLTSEALDPEAFAQIRDVAAGHRDHLAIGVRELRGAAQQWA